MLLTWINRHGWEADAVAPADAQSRPIDWTKNIGYFRSTGNWPIGWGPRPGEPGCRCPAELLIGVAAA
jgi:hypothetical protein